MSDADTDAETDADSERTPSLDPPETEYEEIIHRMGRLRADMDRMQRILGENGVPGEVAAQLGFISGEFNTLTRQVIEFIEEGGEIPEECPVCGETVKEVDELEPGESYDVDRMCIEERTPSGGGRGLVHFTDADGDEDDTGTGADTDD